MHQVNPPYSVTQRTLAREITYVGVGLHSGRKVSMTVQPAPPDTGVVFLRTDVEAGRGLIRHAGIPFQIRECQPLWKTNMAPH